MVATPTISAEEWASIRPKFERLYRIEGKTLKATIAILKREDGFYATERMCKTQIQQWKLQKHNTDKELLHLLRKHLQYKKNGQKRSFRLRKRPVTVYAARKHFERKGIELVDETLERAPSSPTPSALSIVSAGIGDSQSTDHNCLTSTPSVLISQTNSSVEIQSTLSPCRSMALRKPSSPIDERQSITNIWSPTHDIECVLASIRQLCDFSASTIRTNNNTYYCALNIGELNDNIRSVTYLLQAKKTARALQRYKKAQNLVTDMLRIHDPWLLPIVLHFAFDSIAASEQNAAITSILHYMVQAASQTSRQHPIAVVVRSLIDARKYGRRIIGPLLEIGADHLKNTIGTYHELTFCFARMHTFALEAMGASSRAERILYEDYSDLPSHFGHTSVHNLSRLFALAGCRYRLGNYAGARATLDELTRLLPASDTFTEHICTTGCSIFGQYPNWNIRAHEAAERLKRWLDHYQSIASGIFKAGELVDWYKLTVVDRLEQPDARIDFDKLWKAIAHANDPTKDKSYHLGLGRCPSMVLFEQHTPCPREPIDSAMIGKWILPSAVHEKHET